MIFSLIERFVPDELHILAEADTDLPFNIEDAEDTDNRFFLPFPDHERRPLHQRKRTHPAEECSGPCFYKPGIPGPEHCCLPPSPQKILRPVIPGGRHYSPGSRQRYHPSTK